MESKRKITVAVLALQGAFLEHEKILQNMGISCLELRQASDLNKDFDGLILPGGESTVQGKLLKELNMFDILQSKIRNGLPVLATCAGLILLAAEIENDEKSYLGTLPVTVKRNAYGRQLGSFFMKGKMEGLDGEKFPMEFIRAPYITNTDQKVSVLARDNNGHVIGVQFNNQMAFAFHPELTKDSRIHEKFVSML